MYNLPNRDCAAKASNGQYQVAQGGAEKYKTYIANVKKQLVAANKQQFVIIMGKPSCAPSSLISSHGHTTILTWPSPEPNSLANLVTNLNNPRCQEADKPHRDLAVHALKELNLPSVNIYLDAGHNG